MINLSSKTIARLEDEKYFNFLTNFDKVEIALLLLEMKPALILTWFGLIKEDKLLHKQSLKLKEFLKENQFEIKIIFTQEHQKISCKFFCAESVERLEEIISTEWKEGDSKIVIQEKDRARGILLGYPEISVKDYIHGESIDNDMLPEKIKKSPEFKFVMRRLSKNGWQGEFDEIKKNIDNMRRVFPKVYSDVINDTSPVL